MSQKTLIRATPWDAVTFGIPTWEVLEYTTAALEQVARTPGHHTLKVDPLVDKRQIHESGFYYCDTLIEPFCRRAELRLIQHPEALISKNIDKDKALAICHGAFSHGRFHRDFNLPKIAADTRYDNWLTQLLEAEQVYGLYWQEKLAGFIGHSGSNLVLHALSENYRNKGLSKYWWSAVCSEVFSDGYEEVRSSISVTNLAVLKLYISLGFSFENPRDVYHYMVD